MEIIFMCLDQIKMNGIWDGTNKKRVAYFYVTEPLCVGGERWDDIKMRYKYDTQKYCHVLLMHNLNPYVFPYESFLNIIYYLVPFST